MSSIIYDINQKFPFDKLSLANPHGIQGGAYFSKIRMGDDEPFLFQAPKCFTKSGIVSTDKKIYCDLMLNVNNEKFITFLQELEKYIQQLIYEKRDLWFHNNMEMDNIEYFFNPIIRTYKKHLLVRSYVQQPKHIKNVKSLQIYDENENRLTIKDVTKEKKIIAILEGLGIKFTSSSFHFELCLRQVMILEDKPIFHKCLIQMNKHDTKEDKEEIQNTKITLTQTLDNEEEDTTKDIKKVVADKEDQIKNANVSSEEMFEVSPENSIEQTKDTPLSKTIKNDISNNITENQKQPEPLDNESTKLSEDKDDPIDTPSNNNKESLEQKSDLQEINVDLPNEKDCVHLKEPLVVYREIYKKALKKAKAARRLAIQAFLEAKQIKNTFLADEVEESDDDLDTFEEMH
jgi:hypothetical protein